MRRLVGDRTKHTRCPFCKETIDADVMSIKTHISAHLPEGYIIDVVETESKNKNIYPTLFQTYVEGPCACGCGEVIRYPTKKGWSPGWAPPYFKMNHYQRVAPRNSGTFQKGDAPWNKGKRFPDMPRNSGMFVKGNVSANYKGGIAMSDGYAMILDPSGATNPSGGRKRIMRSRIVMEEKLGRKLKRNEIVYHIDLNKSNDDPENLELINRAELMKRTRVRCPRTKKPKGEKVPRVRRTKAQIAATVKRPVGRPRKIRKPKIKKPMGRPRINPKKPAAKKIIEEEAPRILEAGKRGFGICPVCKSFRSPMKGCKCDEKEEAK